MPATSTRRAQRRSPAESDESTATTAAFTSRLGWMVVRRRDHRVARLVFGYANRSAALAAAGCSAPLVEEATDCEQQLVARLRLLAAGRPVDFDDVEVDLSQHTTFQRRVLRACRELGWGDTSTYGQLAARAGAPQAARAVGNIMANNPIPLIIPCHRVVGAAGSLGGFSAPGALAMKRHLLRLEGQRGPFQSG